MQVGIIGTGRMGVRLAAMLADAGHLNERGRPFNPNSIKAMLEG